MTEPKTRCYKCESTDKRVTQEPCKTCSEIHFTKKNFDNNFLDSSKNLMRERRTS